MQRSLLQQAIFSSQSLLSGIWKENGSIIKKKRREVRRKETVGNDDLIYEIINQSERGREREELKEGRDATKSVVEKIGLESNVYIYALAIWNFREEKRRLHLRNRISSDLAPLPGQYIYSAALDSGEEFRSSNWISMATEDRSARWSVYAQGNINNQPVCVCVHRLPVDFSNNHGGGRPCVYLHGTPTELLCRSSPKS